MIGDTIAAIATGMTNSGIGIIRISGSESFDIIDKIFLSKKDKDKKLSNEKTHTVHYGYICENDSIIDEVLVVIMRAPMSYTTEDTVEINTHGGNLIMSRILQVVLNAGARLAEPGEYTKRAFLNGRIDLSQAESVIDIIDAKNDTALKNSVRQLSGELKDRIVDIRKDMLNETAFIESALDDPEHISLDNYSDVIHQVLDKCIKKVDKLVDSADDGIRLKEGIKTAIIGKPNVGKSSILNILLGQDRAIVTDIAGTTRDTLEENLVISGLNLNIVDTAGIRDTEDVVEKIGVQKAYDEALVADLILYVCDSSINIDDEDLSIIDKIKDKQVICLLNKSDLDTKTTESDIKNLIDCDVVSVSAKDGKGLEELKDLIKFKFYSGEIDFNDQIFITNIRHKNLLIDASKSLKLALNSVLDGMPEDFITIDMMAAYESLGLIIGEEVNEDLVDEIFSKFCMGK